jgi:hypothetical protein
MPPIPVDISPSNRQVADIWNSVAVSFSNKGEKKNDFFLTFSKILSYLMQSGLEILII